MQKNCSTNTKLDYKNKQITQKTKAHNIASID